MDNAISKYESVRGGAGGEDGQPVFTTLCFEGRGGGKFLLFYPPPPFFSVVFFFFFLRSRCNSSRLRFLLLLFLSFFPLPPRCSNETILGTKKSLRFYYVSLLIAFGSRVAFLCYYFVLIISISFLSSFFSSFSSFGNVFGIGGILCNR